MPREFPRSRRVEEQIHRLHTAAAVRAHAPGGLVGRNSAGRWRETPAVLGYKRLKISYLH